MPALQIKNLYAFAFSAPEVLTNGYNATVLAALDYDTAVMLQADLVAIHAAVYPRLNAGTPINAKDLEYYRVRTENGETRIIARQWLSGEPTLVSSGTIVATITGVSASDRQLVVDLLRANFSASFTVTFTAN